MEIAIAIISILASAFIAYHIAHRQGKVRHAMLFTTVAPHNFVEKGNINTWLIIIGIPKLDVDRYAIVLPYVFINRDDVPIKALRVQMSYPYDWYDPDVEKLMKPADDKSDPYSSRRALHRPVKGRFLIDYHLKLISPGDSSVIYDVITYRRSALLSPMTGDSSGEFGEIDGRPFKIDTLRYHFSAENYKKAMHELRVVTMPSESMDELEHSLDIIFREVFERVRARGLYLRAAIISRVFKSYFFKANVLLIQPKFKITSNRLAIEDILAGQDGSIYQSAEVGTYLTRLW